MKWIKVAIGAVVAISVIPTIVTSVTDLTGSTGALYGTVAGTGKSSVTMSSSQSTPPSNLVIALDL